MVYQLIYTFLVHYIYHIGSMCFFLPSNLMSQVSVGRKDASMYEIKNNIFWSFYSKK